MTDESKSKHLSRHPLVVLSVGALLSTILSAILVPIYQEYRVKLDNREAAKKEFTQEINAFDGQINTQLNLIVTNFEIFLKRKPLLASTPDANRQYFHKVVSVYERFDQIAWWKLDAAISQFSSSVGLQNDYTEKLYSLAQRYEDILVKRVRLVETAWQLFEPSIKPSFEIDLEWFGTLRQQQQALSDEARLLLREMTKIVRKT